MKLWQYTGWASVGVLTLFQALDIITSPLRNWESLPATYNYYGEGVFEILIALYGLFFLAYLAYSWWKHETKTN